MAVTATMTLSTSATTTAASRRGATSRLTGLSPITRSASTSSRTVRAPRSEHSADPTAPAIINEVTSGAPWRSTPMPLTAPLNADAPIWLAMPPTCTETMTPNGIATRMVGSRETRAMNHAWKRNSCQEKRRPTMSVMTARALSTASSIIEPVVTTPAWARRWKACFGTRRRSRAGPARAVTSPPGRAPNPADFPAADASKLPTLRDLPATTPQRAESYSPHTREGSCASDRAGAGAATGAGGASSLGEQVADLGEQRHVGRLARLLAGEVALLGLGVRRDDEEVDDRGHDQERDQRGEPRADRDAPGLVVREV